ncbi:HD-GYP domain-containing protein [Massilibacterium senegalense]|uniref:HD-GYP domain-containing protein n=1 Tax=Massilibacterium senegalense TaxID=1632858 RepID=UPI000782983B|nr:HD-GYP domain-containing protein [Massilibacterium senegalense]
MRLINIDALKVGMVLHKAVVDKTGRALIQSGMMLNAPLIEKLKLLKIPFVYIEDKRTEGIKLKEGISTETYHAAYTKIKDIFVQINQKKTVKKVLPVERISFTLLETVRTLFDDLQNNKEAISLLTNIHAHDDYLFRHSLNVTIYALAVANELNFLKREVEMIGLGALLHDIGKIGTSIEILGKPGRLTKEEFDEIKKHSTRGYELLRGVYTIPFTVAHCAFQHHERLDGTGYPRQLKGGEIHDFAKIIAICDVFDAVTTNRSYRKAMLPHEALEILYAGCGTQFETKFVEVFKNTVAMYPIGVPVQLNDGRMGIVSRIYKKMSERPIVRILEEYGKEVKEPYNLDLSKELSVMIQSCEI